VLIVQNVFDLMYQGKQSRQTIKANNQGKQSRQTIKANNQGKQ